MKHGSLNSLKMRRLARLLGVPRYAALGCIEALAHVAIDSARHGGIGIHDNEDIAEGIGWAGEANALIEVLVQEGWLDQHDEWRLIIHDWDEHCPNFVKKQLKEKWPNWPDPVPGSSRKNAPQDDAEPPDSRKTKGEQSSTKLNKVEQSCAAGDITQPNPTQPNQEKPNPDGGQKPPTPSGFSELFSFAGFPEAWERRQAVRSELGQPMGRVQAEECLQQLARWGPAAALRSVRQANANGWKGCRPPPGAEEAAAKREAARARVKQERREACLDALQQFAQGLGRLVVT